MYMFIHICMCFNMQEHVNTKKIVEPDEEKHTKMCKSSLTKKIIRATKHAWSGI